MLARIIERMIAGESRHLRARHDGKSAVLDYRLRYELVELAGEIINGRLPMLVGVTDPSLTEALDLAKHAAGCGAARGRRCAAVLLSSQACATWCAIFRSCGRCRCRCFCTTCRLVRILINLETTRACTALQNVYGVKDSGGDFNHFRELLKLREVRPDWTFLIGPEHLLAESVLLGGDGGVNGGANLHPRLFVEWFESAVAKDQATMNALGEQVRLLGQIYQQADEFLAVIRGLKCALSLAGLCDDRLALIEPCDDAAPARIAAIVEQLGLTEAATLAPV